MTGLRRLPDFSTDGPIMKRMTMLKRCVIVWALTLAASATPALAQDEVFAGPRIAVTGVWDNVQHGDENTLGFAYGATAGYEAAIGQLFA